MVQIFRRSNCQLRRHEKRQIARSKYPFTVSYFVFARASVLVPHSEAALPLCMLLIYCDSKEK